MREQGLELVSRQIAAQQTLEQLQAQPPDWSLFGQSAAQQQAEAQLRLNKLQGKQTRTAGLLLATDARVQRAETAVGIIDPKYGEIANLYRLSWVTALKHAQEGTIPDDLRPMTDHLLHEPRPRPWRRSRPSPATSRCR